MLIDTGITIDGVSITNYIAEGGVKWSREDIDGPGAGRNLSGSMIRDRVTTKTRLDITCRKLSYQEMHDLYDRLYPEYVSVYYSDPLFGNRSAIMYCNKNDADILKKYPDGTEKWSPATFALVEK